VPFAPQQSSRPLLPSEIQTLRVQRILPVVMLAVIMAVMALIAAFVIAIAWARVPLMRWFAGGVVLLFVALIVGAHLHMRAARADIADGLAQIKAGRATKKRTGGDGSTWYHATLEGIGEVEVSREQYEAVVIGSSYTVSYSPRVRRAWTVEPG
jgi:hypothetical protein